LDSHHAKPTNSAAQQTKYFATHLYQPPAFGGWFFVRFAIQGSAGLALRHSSQIQRFQQPIDGCAKGSGVH